MSPFCVYSCCTVLHLCECCSNMWMYFRVNLVPLFILRIVDILYACLRICSKYSRFLVSSKLQQSVNSSALLYLFVLNDHLDFLLPYYHFSIRAFSNDFFFFFLSVVKVSHCLLIVFFWRVLSNYCSN